MGRINHATYDDENRRRLKATVPVGASDAKPNHTRLEIRWRGAA
jgi:hypothetical protein